MTLITSFRSEILKTKRTASFYLTLIAAAFGPFLTLLDIVIGEGVSAADRPVILNKLFIDKFEMTGLISMPFFIILICTLLQHIEYKNNAWKQVLTSPQTRANIFISKFMNVQLLIAVFFVANFLFMFVSAAILHVKDPSLHLFSQRPDWSGILEIRATAYMVLLAMCTIQFWLGLRFRNFIIPIAIGICGWFLGTLLVIPMKSPVSAYFPYSFHVYTNLPALKPQLNSICYKSLGYAVLFFTIGLLDFRRRRMIG
jgi:lantibiotic transport system permease protein